MLYNAVLTTYSLLILHFKILLVTAPLVCVIVRYCAEYSEAKRAVELVYGSSRPFHIQVGIMQEWEDEGRWELTGGGASGCPEQDGTTFDATWK